MRIGLQLYTVRDKLSEDWKGVVKDVAAMGYAGVEICGFASSGMEPKELREFLDSLGLRCCGTHTSIDAIISGADRLYEYTQALDCPYVTTSLCGEVAKDWIGIVHKCAVAGRAARKNRVTFTYHNHAQEFQKIGGRYALDILFNNNYPTQVQAEIDTMWVTVGGENPAAYIRKHPCRVPQIHLKDVKFVDGGHQFTEVGTGVVNLESVFAAGHDVGAEWVIVEQDGGHINGDSLESARVSIDNLLDGGLI